MRTLLYVISDLHLGGEAGKDNTPGFQMCPPRNQAQLARFIEGLPSRTPDVDVRLIIAGDIVDFLAEKDFQAFTIDTKAAKTKFQNIIDNTRQVWTALNEFVKGGSSLTLMLGNHDIELCLPGVRQLLLDTIGEGRVEFIYDNQAYTFGDKVLIEHGNRFDAWNAVPHGALRRVRSQLSRGTPPTPFPIVPGSNLVVRVINRLKKDYSFVDLLKPENAGALPVLAALGAGSLRDVWGGFKEYCQKNKVDYDENQEPVNVTYISSKNNFDQKLFRLAEDITAGGNAANISAIGDEFNKFKEAASEKVREYRRNALFDALRKSSATHRNVFNLAIEEKEYLDAAKSAAQNGFQVVVYGHTHLPKRISLADKGKPLPVYLNTGTWADLMRIPDALWDVDENAAREAMREFVGDLEKDQVERWRRCVPTFAKIELDGDSVINGDIYFADGDGNEPVSTEALLSRLKPEFSHV